MRFFQWFLVVFWVFALSWASPQGLEPANGANYRADGLAQGDPDDDADEPHVFLAAVATDHQEDPEQEVHHPSLTGPGLGWPLPLALLATQPWPAPVAPVPTPPGRLARRIPHFGSDASVDA
jgi:hypothetical protein